MKKLTTIAPYGDTQLIWNSTVGQYELNFEFVNSNFSNPFQDSGILKQRIRLCSDVIYNYIYSHCNTTNLPIIQNVISKTEEGRSFILSVLISQMRADLENGYSDTGKVASINVSNGQILPREEIKRNQICVEAEEKIMNYNSLYFGFNIMVACSFPLSLRSFLC